MRMSKPRKKKKTMAHEVKIETLRRGDRFYLLLETTGLHIYGTVLNIGGGSATVKIDPRGEGREVAKLNKLTGEYDTVKIAPRPVIEHWSLETPVFVTDGLIETPQLTLEMSRTTV